MEDAVHTGAGGIDALVLFEVAWNDLHAKATQKFLIASGAGQSPDPFPPAHQLLCHMASQEAGGTGNQANSAQGKGSRIETCGSSIRLLDRWRKGANLE